MRLATLVVLVCLALPAYASAQPNRSDRKSAAQDCREERSANLESFRAKYGENRNDRNAMGKCVSQKAKQKAAERRRRAQARRRGHTR